MTDLVIATSLRDNAAALLAREGLTAEGRRPGETVKHPAVSTLRGASDMIRKASRDLGIVPPAAGAAQVPPDPGYKDPARLLTGW